MNEDRNYAPLEELRRDWPAAAVIALMLVMGAIAYPHLPARVPTHFGLNGQPNRWSSPLFAAFFSPLLALLIWLGMLLLPAIDPRRRNYVQFAGFYRAIRLAVALVLLVVDASVLWRGVGHPLDVGRIAILAVSLLFVFFGNSLGRIRNNWFVGIRTPWTLSNEEVWRRTHRFASRLFVIAGLVPLLAFVFDRAAAAVLLLVLTLVAAGGSVIYSYVVYSQLTRH